MLPLRAQTDWKAVFLKLGAAAVPILTLGAGSPVMFAVLAFRRRSLALWVSAAVYLGVAVPFWVLAGEEGEESTTGDVIVWSQILAIVAASIQAAIVVASGRRAARRDSAAAERRREARQLAAERPQTARTLGIGRPDLHRQYDDGGLVELNDAPAEVLATLPGVTPQIAAAIVANRVHHRFQAVDELWSRGLLPGVPTEELTDRLLIISVQDRI